MVMRSQKGSTPAAKQPSVRATRAVVRNLQAEALQAKIDQMLAEQASLLAGANQAKAEATKARQETRIARDKAKANKEAQGVARAKEKRLADNMAKKKVLADKAEKAEAAKAKADAGKWQPGIRVQQIATLAMAEIGASKASYGALVLFSADFAREANRGHNTHCGGLEASDAQLKMVTDIRRDIRNQIKSLVPATGDKAADKAAKIDAPKGTLKHFKVYLGELASGKRYALDGSLVAGTSAKGAQSLTRPPVERFVQGLKDTYKVFLRASPEEAMKLKGVLDLEKLLISLGVKPDALYREVEAAKEKRARFLKV